MYERLGTTTLATGESIEMGVVLTPDEALGKDAQALLAHKSAAWQVHIESALSGATDELETRFHLATLDGRPVANIMTVERLGVGILGHVFTRPEHRRKGICSALMSLQMEHFRARGGKCLVLGTGYDTAPYHIYRGFGFRGLRGGFMRHDAGDQQAFEQAWFAPTDTSIVPGRWGHWPTVSILAATATGEVLRSLKWAVFDIGLLEHPYLKSVVDLERGGGAVRILENASGAAVGAATAMPHEGWPNVWAVDAFVHPNFADRRADLIGALPLSAGLCLAHVAAHDRAALSAFRSAGFEPTGAVPGLLRMGHTRHDVAILSREGPS